MRTKETFINILLIVLLILMPAIVSAENEEITKGTKTTQETETNEEDEQQEQQGTSNTNGIEENEENEVNNKNNLENEGKDLTDKSNLTWTDVSNLKLEVTRATSVGKVSYKLNVSGVSELKGHTYYTFITNGTKEPYMFSADVVEKDDILDVQGDAWQDIIPKGYNCNIDEYLELNGDIYYSLMEVQQVSGKTFIKYIVSKRKLERPQQLPLGNRIACTFSNDRASFISSVVYSSKNDRNQRLKVKIGQITDTDILLSLKNNESNALEKLLAYAKTAKTIYYNTLIYSNDNKDKLLKASDLVDNAVYFIYSELDDENGKYFPVEDIGYAQALIDDAKEGKFRLFTNIDWNFLINNEGNNNTPSPDITTPPTHDQTVSDGVLPQTGELKITFILFLALANISAICIYKYNKYKGIDKY